MILKCKEDQIRSDGSKVWNLKSYLYFLCESSRVFSTVIFYTLHVLLDRWWIWEKIWQRMTEKKKSEEEVTTCAGRWLDGDVWRLTPVKKTQKNDVATQKPELWLISTKVVNVMTSPSSLLFIGSRDVQRVQSSQSSHLLFSCSFVLFLWLLNQKCSRSSFFLQGCRCCIVGTVVSHRVSTTVALSSVNAVGHHGNRHSS